MKVHFSARMSMVGLLAAAIVWPAMAIAQQQPPLAEVARQEAERRKSTKTTQRVITTKDLPESAKRSPSAAQAESAGAPAASGSHSSGAHPTGDQAAAAGQGPAASTNAGDARGTEEQWRGRITQARESVRRNEAFAEALQSRINALTTDFVNRDNPVQRRQVGEDRVKALAELERVRSDIEKGKKQIGDIEEEARKAGVPPGWLR
jgi:hypothetical protein